MDSALRPREIQARIRAGETLDEVARLSGEPAERIQRFAAPVLAEREHVAGLALTSTVRRRGEVGGHRTLRVVVGDQLLAHGVDLDAVAWDAWRNEDRRWTVQATWRQGEERSARFQFDLVSRFSVADDAGARWLIAEDEESADLDELALVHAVGGDPTHATSSLSVAPQSDQDEEPTISLPDEPTGFEARVEDDDWNPRSAATPQEIREELEAEIDAYGVVPEGRSELDVLYDMLSGIAEDSINIYAGLSDPVVSEPVGDLLPSPEPSKVEPEIETQVEPEINTQVDPEIGRREPLAPQPAARAPEPESRSAQREPDPEVGAPEPEAHAPQHEARAPQPEARAPQPKARATEPGAGAGAEASAPGVRAVPTAPPAAAIGTPPAHGRPLDLAGADAPGADPTRAVASPDAAGASLSGTGQSLGSVDDQVVDPSSGQPSLVDDEPTVPVAPGASKRRGARKKRASVPSWDEIMFGGPKPG